MTIDGPLLNADAADPPAIQSDPSSLARALVEASLALPTSIVDVRRLSSALHHVEPTKLDGDHARIAFFLDVYNALLRHALHERPIRGHLFRHLRLFSRAAYRIGAHRWSLGVIEHGVLRRNRRAPGSIFRLLGDGDPRAAAAPSRVDPRVHFALNCGARSCPKVRAYQPATLERDLDDATASYFASEASVEVTTATLTLPYLCKLYAVDFGPRDQLPDFAARYLGARDATFVREHRAQLRVRFASYDWNLQDP